MRLRSGLRCVLGSFHCGCSGRGRRRLRPQCRRRSGGVGRRGQRERNGKWRLTLLHFRLTWRGRHGLCRAVI